jgi:hypothetical protein
MDIRPYLEALQTSGVALGIRDSLYWFPTLEAVHVVALSLVFGTIMIVDLRVLGVASTRRIFRRVSGDALKWTWAAFAVAVVTGALMFTSSAVVYFGNTAFRIKMGLLLLAGLNMLLFHFVERDSDGWHRHAPAPRLSRICAIVSLVLWIAVIGAGRTIGFTIRGAAAKEAPPPPDIDFDSFLESGPDAPPATNPQTPGR